MLAIVNVTENDSQELDDYEIRVNARVIGRFKHMRGYEGAARCLRDAADALDARASTSSDELLESLIPVFKRMQDH